MTCSACEKQPRGKREAPLSCMISHPTKQPVSARFHGRGTDDTFYLCKECGHEWMHEGGKYGYGWV
ncbi:hypothetical protein SAMN03097723_3518 [Pantoea eucalypti]|jgi:hypothetical protein|nr:hypothetical protein SAMN03097723_3518 [Pantoea eucalypti]